MKPENQQSHLDNTSKLYKSWDDLWSKTRKNDGLTILGKRMQKAKQRALTELLPKLQIRSVLEAGCGLGHLLQVYHQAGLECTGIDISPSAVKACLAKGLNAEICDLANEYRLFDLVSSDGMLEHFLNFEPIARHMMRVSRKYVLLIQPNHESLLGWVLPYLANKIKRDHIIFEYNYRIGDFVDIFENCGFSLTANQPVFANVFRLLLFVKN